MAWTATITSKIIVNGLLKVEVSYTDGTQTFLDRYETRNPEATWLRDNVRRRIKDLDVVVPFYNTMPTGVYDPGSEVIVKTDEEIYLNKLSKFRALQRMVDIGVITTANSVYVNTKHYLIDNYNIDYIK